MIRQWSFTPDMDANQLITISDVWLWLKWLYFFPGDGLVYIILVEFQSVASFFEMNGSSFGGPFSGFVSFFLWFVIYGWLRKEME